jgi:hypothetical protein
VGLGEPERVPSTDQNHWERPESNVVSQPQMPTEIDQRAYDQLHLGITSPRAKMDLREEAEGHKMNPPPVLTITSHTGHGFPTHSAAP